MALGIEVMPSSVEDIPQWSLLAAEVEPEFGAVMADDPSWVDALHRHVNAGTALGARDATSHEMLGGMWLVEHDNVLKIGWLAVFSNHRGKGVGRALLEAAVAAADGGILEVVTFGAGHPMADAAEAAAKLYRSAGFKPVAAAAEGPDGTPRVLLRRS